MNGSAPSKVWCWRKHAVLEGPTLRLVDVSVTVKDRILLHLLDHWGRLPRGEWPEALTQDGIAGVIGISRSHVAVTLPDLIEEQLVEDSLERVAGRARRVKVYGLTHTGGRKADQMAQGLLRTTVTAYDDSGEWDLPLDGLIQVHKVHMLVALRLVDEDNRIDLREAAEMVRPREAPSRVAVEEEVPEPPEAAPVGEPVEVPSALVEGQAPPDVPPAAEAPIPATPDGVSAAPDRAERPPTLVPPTSAPPQWGQGPPGQPPYAYPQYPQRAFFWSPLRHGTGRRPQPASVAAELVLGFLALIAGVAFIGIAPFTCIVIWIPLVIVGAFSFYIGFRDLWAVGEQRESWTAAALSGLAFVAVTMTAFAAFGPETVYDLLWAGLILGVPSLILMANPGRNVARRGSFALTIGPVLTMAAMAMAVLDPEGIGRTGAMPVFMIAVGVIWTFMGWVMTRGTPDVKTTSIVIGGGAIGVLVATVAGAAHLASDGDLTVPLVVAVALWALAAAYVALVFLLPSLSSLRPDSATAYRAVAVAGSAALLTAAVIFIGGGFYTIGIVEAVIAVALIAMVVPDLHREDRAGLLLAAAGCLVAVASVLAVSVVV